MTSILGYCGNAITELVAHGIERVRISLLLKTNFWFQYNPTYVKIINNN